MARQLFSVEVTGTDEVIARFNTMNDRIQKKLLATVTTLTQKLQAKIMDNLSDKILHVRTGALRSHVFKDVTQDAKGTFGEVYVSRDVPYAAIHEFGGVINHPGGTAYFIDSKTGMAQFVSNAAAKSDMPRTKPHQIVMPERSYARSALQDMKVEILSGIRNALQEELSKT